MNELIQQAVKILNQSGTVAFATETVYGLGANAADPIGLQKIFQIKGRPQAHPLIVHLKGLAQLSDWATEIPDAAFQLAEAFWPGPLTLILKKSRAVSDLVTGGQPTVGIRVPNHPIAQALLQAFGGGLAAPSANRFGRISPTTAAAVRAELGETVDLILDGGQCAVGLESTIVDLTSAWPTILRPGGISAGAIQAVLQGALGEQGLSSPRVSGSLKSHYAPHTLTKIVVSVETFLHQLTTDDLPCVVLTREAPHFVRPGVFFIKMPEGPEQYAYELYATLREIDLQAHRQIVIEAVPDSPEWAAVKDRIGRASAG